MVGEGRTNPTFFELLAYRFGFERVESRLPLSVHPLVLWAVSLVLFDLFVLQGVKHLQGYTVTFLRNPAWLIQPVFATMASVAVVFLDRRYGGVLAEIDVERRTSEPSQFRNLKPYRLVGFLYVLAVGYRCWQVFVGVGVGTLLEIGGLAELVGISLVTVGYHVVYVEFIATYLAIVVLLPRRIRRSDFRLDFLDPEGLGGLRPVGELAKTAYYFIVVGLIGYLVIIYGPHILNEYIRASYPEPGLVINVGFTAVWLLTIGTMAYGFGQLHWFMKRTKREELVRLSRRCGEVVDNRFDVGSLEISNESAFEDLRRRMHYVDRTSEYPTTFTMWSQILISVVLPKAVQLFLERI